MKIAVPVWVLILLVLTIVALIVIIWSIKRRRRPHLDLEESEGTNEVLMPSIAGVTQGTIVDGNKVELIQNGALWDRMFEDMRNAKATINFETFLSKCGTLTERLTNLLIDKQNQGVQVRM